MNPNKITPVSWTTDDHGEWTAYLGWNGLALVVMAETGGSAFMLDSDTNGILNQNVLGPTPDGWIDLGCQLIDLHITRGASLDAGALTRYEAGTCTLILDNEDLRFDPSNSNGPFFDSLNLGTTVVVMAVDAAVIDLLVAGPEFNPWSSLFGLFKGTIDDWQCYGYETEERRAQLTLVDDVARLQQYNGPELSPQGAGDTTEERLNRILAEAGWSTRTGSFDGATFDTIVFPAPGVANPTHVATTLAQPAWEMMLRAGDSASRSIVVEGNGRLIASPINPNADLSWRLWDWGCEDLQIPLVSVDVEYGKEQLINKVDAARVGGTLVPVADETSVSRYGPYRTGRNDLTVESDVDVATYAGLIVNWSSEPKPRVTRLRVSPDLWPSDDLTVDFMTQHYVTVDLQVNAVAVIVGNAGLINVEEQRILDRLAATYDTVDVFDDSTPDDGTISEAVYAALLIMPTASTITVGTKWKTWAGSVAVLKSGLWNNHGLANVAGTNIANEAFTVIDPPPAWLSLSLGSYDTAADGSVNTVGAAVTSTVSGDADLVASEGADSGGLLVLWTYEEGGTLSDSTVAAGRRAAFGLTASNLVNPSLEWLTLFDDLMTYLVPSIYGQEVESTPGVENAWRTILDFAGRLGAAGAVGAHRHHIDVPVLGTTHRITDTVAIRGVNLTLDDSVADLTFTTSTISQFLDVFILDDDVAGILDSGYRVA